MENDDPVISPLLSKGRNKSTWVPTTTTNKRNTKENQQEDENKYDDGEGGGRCRGGGPTTDTGRRKKAEADAAKQEKERQKREKNRKKRKAYRERQREKQYGPKSTKPQRMYWSDTRTRGEGENEKKTKEAKKKPKKKSEHQEQESTTPTDNRATNKEGKWEVQIQSALQKGDFGMLRNLFARSLDRAARNIALSNGLELSSSRRRHVTKHYRMLSSRFHPDRHAGSGEENVSRFKIAFQALNAAYQELTE